MPDGKKWAQDLLGKGAAGAKAQGWGRMSIPGMWWGLDVMRPRPPGKTQILEDCEHHAKEFGVDLEKVKAFKVSAKEETLTESQVT